MACLVITQGIRDLAAKFQGETVESIRNAVGLWQEKNNKGIEEIPSASELNKFLTAERESALSKVVAPSVTITESTGSYSQRTKENADWSDVTISFAADFDTAGEKATKRYAGNKFVPVKLYFGTPEDNTEFVGAAEVDAQRILEVLKKNNLSIKDIKLNVAGNGIYSLSKTGKRNLSQEELNNYITEVIKELQKLGVTISEIRSGGQTGADEAGIIAAQRLGIPASIVAPKGYKFRDVTGKDISNEEAFKARFVILPTPSSIKNFDQLTTPTDVTIEEQEKVYLDFDPVKRRARVSLIARLFSNILTKEVEKYKKDLNEAIALADANTRESLVQQLNNVDRVTTIQRLTPGNLFGQIQNVFRPYINLTDEERIQMELTNLRMKMANKDKNVDTLREEAKAIAEYKFNEYNKILDNFRALCEEACSIIATTENVKIAPQYYGVTELQQGEVDPDGNVLGAVQNDDTLTREESVKDGWMIKFRNVSSMSSLSQAVRKVIMTMPRVDKKGIKEKDDLGFDIYLDADYVHAVLIDKLKDMITADDLIPMLQDLAKTKPWIKKIIALLNNDNALFSQFYQDFRKDFSPYWIQKRHVNSNGQVTWETVAVNKPEGTYYLLDAWRDNYESGTILDKDSVYDKTGGVSKENAQKGLDIVNELLSKFNKLSTEEAIDEINKQTVLNKFVKMLRMIGIDTESDSIKEALLDIPVSEGITIVPPFKTMLNDLNILFSGVIKGQVKDTEDSKGDLINTFGSVYNSIALALADVTEDAIESSTREGDKSYYAHTNPNYLGKIVKQLKNVRKVNEQSYLDFLEQEFGKYEWFKKDGEWLNDIIAQLAQSPDARKALEHKVLLNADKKEFDDWDELDTLLVLLTEYGGITDTNPVSKEGKQYAWYSLPIEGDAPQAEFLKLRKYVSGEEFDEDGKPVAFDEVIIRKMVNLVLQEYNRIMLVNARAKKIAAGDTSVSPIASFDITYKEDGTIDNIGGAEFKFLPQLNKIAGFIDRITELKKGSGEELENYIKAVLRDVMETSFEEDYDRMNRIGLFEETADGKYKYLKGTGKNTYLKTLSKNMQKAKEMLGNLWTDTMNSLWLKVNAGQNLSTKEMTQLIDSINKGLELLNTKESLDLRGKIRYNDSMKEKLREYFYNTTFATAEMIQLLVTDLAYYKDMKDFQKRFKEVHAPSLRLNTKATFNGELVGRQYEKTILLKDDEIVSTIYKDIEEVLDAKVKSGELSKLDKDYILSQYKKINVADAQAYRSLSSYKAVMVMSGQWTDEMERAYRDFKDGTWDIRDFSVIWQTKKPFVYTQVAKDSGVEGHTDMKVGVQHKNSEFLLLALHQTLAGSISKSAKLRAINKFMEENGVDVVQFESTTKTGKQGVIDINNANTEEEVLKTLKDATGIGTDAGENPNVVHAISYEDYGIQTATPEHIFDVEQLIGSQIRKLIAADIADNALITVGNKTMTKAEWIKLYNQIITENILDSFKEVNEIFADPKEVEKVLLDEVRGNPQYSQDLLHALTLDENGQFNLPLYDPVATIKILNLINSIIKNRVTKQKIKGGALIQVSCYGLTDELKIVWEGEGENKHIKYIECYMPAYSKQFFKPLMTKDENGNYFLDVNKLPDSLRKLVGYRVPTEDKYSMAPLYIKGFLPQQNGSAIMLPAEITTIAGSDFDVDKLYILLPEFNVKKIYNLKSAWDDFYKDADNADIAAEIDANLGAGLEDLQKRYPGDYDDFDVYDYLSFLKDQGIKKYQLSDKAQERFSKWFEKRKKLYDTGRTHITKIEYDFSKQPKDNSRLQRNNLFIDMIYGVLTNPDTAAKIMNPGGFEPQKRAARVINIIKSSTLKSLKSTLKSLGIEVEGDNFEAAISKLNDNQLKKLEAAVLPSINPLSPLTYVDFHIQNATGGKMIGIYANHNANHALMLHTDLGVDETNGSFVFNGRTETSLHQVRNSRGHFVSRNNAGFLAASVDNVKEPVLAFLNQNEFTADLTMLLSRLGYEALEIGVLLNQPIILEITQEYFKRKRDGIDKNTIIDEVINRYMLKGGISQQIEYGGIKGNKFLLKDLINNILIESEARDLTDIRATSNLDVVEFFRNQAAVGILFKRMLKTADALGDLVQATRSDTQGGAAGPSIADTFNKIAKVRDVIDRMESDTTYPLTGADVIETDIDYDGDEDALRNKLYGSKLPYLQAFYTLGVEQSVRMLMPYFAQFTEPFMNVMDQLRGLTKLGRLDVKSMNIAYNDLLAYIMSKTSFFGDDETMTAEQKRDYFINQFPKDFTEFVASHPEVGNLEFIKRLFVVPPKKNVTVSTIIFKNVGQLTEALRERYERDWASLLYSEDPEVRAFGLNLFRYNYFRNGFAFGPSTFIHLAPVAIRKAIPGYVEELRRLMTDYDDYTLFVEQHVYNHLDNKKYAPEIPESASSIFIDENKEALDRVTITIDAKATAGDRKAVKEVQNSPDGKVYTFMQFISRPYKGGYIYYKLNVDETTEDTGVYERIYPLGIKSSFIEYEYGKDADELKSVITEEVKPYDKYGPQKAVFDEDVDIDDLDATDMPISNWSSMTHEAFELVYGEAIPESRPSTLDIDLIAPNVDYKDLDNENLCGAEVIKTY